MDFLGSGLRPWDLGALKAHQLSAVTPTPLLEHYLDRMRRRRRGLWAQILPGRKRYLDGMINGLEKSLERRQGEVHQTLPTGPVVPIRQPRIKPRDKSVE